MSSRVAGFRYPTYRQHLTVPWRSGLLPFKESSLPSTTRPMS